MLGKSVSAFRQLLIKHTQVRVVRKIVGTLKEYYNMWKENWTVQSETFIRSLKKLFEEIRESFIHWFTPQVATNATAEPSGNREPGASST